MRVLVTRPREDCAELEALLRKDGHDVLVAPLLSIELLHPQISSDAMPQAFVFTSQNSVRAIQSRDTLQRRHFNLPVFAVGTTTARSAREAGFHNVRIGPGDARGLIDLIRQHAEPGSGRLVYICGEQRSTDLEQELAAFGFSTETLIAYRAVASRDLPSDITRALGDREIDAITLMSSRTAAIFVNVIKRSGIQNLVRSIDYICISDAAASALQPLGARKITVAETPTIEGIVGTVNRIRRQAEHRT